MDRSAGRRRFSAAPMTSAHVSGLAKFGTSARVSCWLARGACGTGIVGDDPLPFSVETNEKTLAALVDYALSQHIITKRPDLEEIFI